MLWKRLLTAAVGISAAIFLINGGGIPYYIVVNILMLIALWEFMSMLQRSNFAPSLTISIVIGLLMIAVAYWGNSEEMGFLITALMLSVLLKLIFNNDTFTVPDAAFTILGTLYVGWLFSFLILLRNVSSEITDTPLSQMSLGAIFTWLAVLTTWASDTFAYFIGKAFGKRKLCPHISPGKTVEGLFGGLAGSLIVAVSVGLAVKLPIVHSAILGLIIGTLAPLGDLVESVFKRFSGVKDSGKIFPGHGGVLDRFDSIFFVIPAAYYYIRAFLIN
jgi:phosphatidate cytidylyltransferase